MARKRKGSSKAGRPRKEGNRYPSGKLKPETFAPMRRDAETGALVEREREGASVYVIGPSFGLQKIGHATDVPKRLRVLQTGCPFELRVHYRVAIGANAETVERAVHRHLRDRHYRGEWFNVTPTEAVDAIKAVMQMGKA